MKFLFFTTFVTMLFTLVTQAQAQFPNTLSYDESLGSPAADLTVIDWLSGHWRGEAFGGTTEEVWTPPLGGSMMGAFKLVSDGKLDFYELETICEEGGTLIIRLKHFNPDLKGWEEKDKAVEFRLVKVESNKIYFDGFTIEKISSNEIAMYVRIKNEEQLSEVKFPYKRVIPEDTNQQLYVD